MRFLKRIIRKIVASSLQDKNEFRLVSDKSDRLINASDSSDEILESNRQIHFRVYDAVGGKVVQTRHYNEKTDRMNQTLYIVPDNADLGQELSHIITREYVSR